MAARVSPSRSWRAACRHLFHYLADAQELRSNPIAARFFPSSDAEADALGIDALRQAVLRAFEGQMRQAAAEGKTEECRRYQFILVSHLLEGESAASVAQTLHLSLSQFYRERAALCERVVQAISAEAKPTASQTFALRPDVVAMAHAGNLMEACETRRALELLDSVAHSTSSTPRKIEALCLMASVLSSELDHHRASERIRFAKELFEQNASDMAESDATASTARIEFTKASLAASLGKCADARRSLRSLFSSFRSSPFSDEELRAFHVDALIFASEWANSNGDFKAFRENLAAANLVFSGLERQSRRQRARLSWLAGRLCNEPGTSATFDGCASWLANAKRTAESDGLIRIAVDAALDLMTTIGNCLGDYGSAAQQGRALVQSTLLWRDPVLIGKVCAIVASVQCTHREFTQALSTLELAHQRGKCDARSAVTLQYVAADAYTGLRDYRRALTYAQEAHRCAVLMSNKRLTAAALRQSALALYGDRQEKLARDYIDEAIRLTESSGNRASAAYTYVASSRITGNREHARIADSLNRNVAALARRSLQTI